METEESTGSDSDSCNVSDSISSCDEQPLVKKCKLKPRSSEAAPGKRKCKDKNALSLQDVSAICDSISNAHCKLIIKVKDQLSFGYAKHFTALNKIVEREDYVKLHKLIVDDYVTTYKD